MFSLGDVADLMEVGEHIHSLNPSSHVVAVGVSMAGWGHTHTHTSIPYLRGVCGKCVY